MDKETKPFELKTSGELILNSQVPTLAEMEAFCAEARRLGLKDNHRLHSLRQGIFGPVKEWYFDIPVEPKKVD